MKYKQFQRKRKRIVVVSAFSGMDLFLLSMIVCGMLPGFAVERNIYAAFMHAANFKNPDGSSVMEFINISEEEFKHRKSFKLSKGSKPLEDSCIKKDGQYLRTKEIQEVTGKEIRETIEQKYGKDIIIILIGGPPCQDFTKLNSKRNKGSDSRNLLLFEYLRILDELRPDVAIMEEVPDLKLPEFEHIYSDFIAKAKTLPYFIGEQEMRSIHYGGNQNRARVIMLFIHEKYGMDACFPIADEVNVKRVRDFLDIDYFCPGSYDYGIKSKNDLMTTVTRGNPKEFYKDGRAFPPPIKDLLLCFDVEEGMYFIPDWIPQDQVKQAIGNAVCLSVGKALAKIIIEKILRVRPDGDGYWVPIDGLVDPNEGGDDVDDESDSENGNDNGIPSPNPSGEVNPPIQGDQFPADTSAVPEVINAIPVMPVSLPVDSAADLTLLAEPVKPFPSEVTISVPITAPTIPSLRIPQRKIISSLDLAAMKFKSLNFTGAWEHFIGCPIYNFNCIIYGKPGGGKSTLAIQFAKYLSDNFGRVVYISGEEGISKTLQNKFMLTGSLSGDIDVADLRSYEDIIRNVASESYRFIFIDSLNTMKISVDELRQIRSRYNGSAIITISQVTKAGLIRGSNEFEHDCDVSIIVEEGIATTPKNRFRIASETTYSVFSENNILGNHLEFTHENL